MKGIRCVVWCKVLLLVLAGWTTSSHAAVIGTAEHLHSASATQTLTLRESVHDQLVALGVTNEDALARVAALSQEELQLLADKMDELPAGGIAGVIGVIFIVLLILELVGVTNVFTAI
jgi:hypothetical protein